MELFLSYARQDQPRAQALRGRLDQLGHSVWVDQRLTGGQQWWDEILRRIAAADALVMLVSSGSLRSAACAAERGYAGALGKPILPVLVEPLPAEMLPADVQLLQLVDYTAEGADSAIRLAGAVAQLRTAPPLPDPLPAPPPVPLSYLSQLGHKLAGAAPLTLEEQVAIAARLETATGAADAEERSTARHLLQALRQRSDLLAATQHIIDRAESAAAGRGSPPGAEQVSPAAGQVSPVSPAGQGEPPPEAARWQS
ncbi:MAG: TIR domain-containing protein, partial [Micromonosporaceae bacterium]